MTRPIEIHQGEDKTVIVTMNDDISSATEVEFYIDTPTQIKKTYTGGHITGITATQFTVQIDAGDTESVKDGEYRFQARATIAGKKYNIKFTPDKIKLKKSVFVSLGRINDYNN